MLATIDEEDNAVADDAANSLGHVPIVVAPPLTLEQIVQLEPYIANVLADAWTSDLKPNRWKVYHRIKERLSTLVGWTARRHDLRSTEALNVVMGELTKAIERPGRRGRK